MRKSIFDDEFNRKEENSVQSVPIKSLQLCMFDVTREDQIKCD